MKGRGRGGGRTQRIQAKAIVSHVHYRTVFDSCEHDAMIVRQKRRGAEKKRAEREKSTNKHRQAMRWQGRLIKSQKKNDGFWTRRLWRWRKRQYMNDSFGCWREQYEHFLSKMATPSSLSLSPFPFHMICREHRTGGRHLKRCERRDRQTDRQTGHGQS